MVIHEGLPIGYSDPLSVRPGETVRFMVSCDEPYRAELVRLLHGDADPAGPGFREERIAPLGGGRLRGRVQQLRLGSHAVAEPPAGEIAPRALTLAAWIFPTLPGGRTQTVLARWEGDERAGRGYALAVTPDGDLALRLGDRAGAHVEVRTGRPLLARTWHLAIGSYDLATRVARVHQLPVASWTTPAVAAHAEGPLGELGEPAAEGLACLLAAQPDSKGRAACHFDGKLDRPTIFSTALTAEEARRRLERSDRAAHADLVAAWDFSREMASVHVPDASGNGWDARLVNMPTRAVTGHDWRGTESAWRHAPTEYAAVHFHSDDLGDADWEADFELDVPQELEGGVYAARVETVSGAVDHVPVIVRSRRARAPIAVVLPTLTYLAYADERISRDFEVLSISREDRYVTASGLLSQYNRHRDGSGVAYASSRRPLPNLRPSYRYWLTGQPHGLGADLYLLDWLRHERFEHDLLVDEDVHAGGAELLGAYRVVLTGSHPEYVTLPETHAFGDYVRGGGRLMYLGGNGFTMVTGIHPERPHVSEIRRTASHAGLWDSAPGEAHLSTTGEPGGHWSARRERPRGLVGVETVGMGFRGACAYRREPDSFDPRAAFVFEGVGADEAIGGFGLGFGGAAGYEVDGLDVALGTPRHALLLARARGFGDHYVPLSADPDVRADMVLLETPAGGWVFSVGSIAWTSALSHDRYANNVARITGNVLRRFSAP